MNINLNQNEISLILDALEDYRLRLSMWANSKTINVNFYPYSESDVGNLVNYLNEAMINYLRQSFGENK